MLRGQLPGRGCGGRQARPARRPRAARAHAPPSGPPARDAPSRREVLLGSAAISATAAAAGTGDARASSGTAVLAPDAAVGQPVWADAALEEAGGASAVRSALSAAAEAVRLQSKTVALTFDPARSEVLLYVDGDADAQRAPQRVAVRLPESAGTAAVAKRSPAGGVHEWTYWDGSTVTIRERSSGFARALEDDAALMVEVSTPAAPAGGADGLRQAELTVELDEAGEWYGGAHLMQQLWPLGKSQWEVGPHYPFDNGPQGINTLVGTHWVTSKGLLVAVDPDTPLLHVGLNAPQSLDGVPRRVFGVGVQNSLRGPLLPHALDDAPRSGDGKLRLQARNTYADPLYLHPWQKQAPNDRLRQLAGEGREPRCTLRAVFALRRDAKEATELAHKLLPRPPKPPLVDLMAAPIWTTWAKEHAAVDQTKVLRYAAEIAERDLPRSVLEIDDRWQMAYGDLEFDAEKFPDPCGMVDKLHELGFKVTLWVMPLLEARSQAYLEARRKGFLVKGGTPPSPAEEVRCAGAGGIVKVIVDTSSGIGCTALRQGQFRWWGTQPVSALDVTNPAAVDWFVGRLERLQAKYGLDGFKFDAGEPCFLPAGAQTHEPLSHVSEYTRKYITNVASRFECAEVRCGHHTQSAPLLVRMGDRDSVWAAANGLRSLIPTLLTSAVLGYPFTLPDMVGGNAYWGQMPDTELFVRWAQVSAFMPSLQFSIPPWQVGEVAETACAELLALRAALLVPRMQELAGAASARLTPICRPLWWLDPADARAHAVDDQFAVGDDLIVAPVVRAAERSRRVFLPSGRWQELDARGEPLGAPVSGSRFVTVDAPLSRLPLFLRVAGAAALA